MELNKTLIHIKDQIKNNHRNVIILGGDFNVRDKNWDTYQVIPENENLTTCGKVLKILEEHQRTHLQREPTREDKILDLICTNKAGLLKNIITITGISNHEFLLADCETDNMGIYSTMYLT